MKRRQHTRKCYCHSFLVSSLLTNIQQVCSTINRLSCYLYLLTCAPCRVHSQKGNWGFHYYPKNSILQKNVGVSHHLKLTLSQREYQFDGMDTMVQSIVQCTKILTNRMEKGNKTKTNIIANFTSVGLFFCEACWQYFEENTTKNSQLQIIQVSVSIFPLGVRRYFSWHVFTIDGGWGRQVQFG